MRMLYNVLVNLIAPLAILRLYWRARHAPDYKRRIRERFAHFDIPKEKQHGIWVHAVSVGEVLASQPLIQALIKEYPSTPIIVTCMTPTGSERIKFNLPPEVFHVYAPYDIARVVGHFLDKVQPELCILMETELWPNILRVCRARNIPTFLANARLSARSARGYGLPVVKSMTRSMLQDISLIAAQAKADANRFIELGAKPDKVHAVGNMKFDFTLPQSVRETADMLRSDLGSSRAVCIAASTHEGEDELVLRAHKKVCEQHPDSLLILVPRHPERFDKVFHLCEKQGFNTLRRSQSLPCLPEHQIYLGDTMGELRMLLGAADVAFIGGSLVPTGGHNMLEAALYGMPILTGPNTFNFAEVTELLLDAGGMVQVPDWRGLADTLSAWLADANLRMSVGQKALHVIENNRGALDRHMRLLQTILPEKVGR